MKVLISGYYGFGNLGDESLFSGLKNALLTAGHSVTVLSNNPKLSREMHDVKSLHRYHGLIQAIINSDVVISGGGGLLQNKTSTRSLQYYLWVIRIAKIFKKKVIVFGQSIGPLDERGKAPTSVELAGHLQRWQQEGEHVCFIIGGADGMTEHLKQQARLMMRLSSLTLPHGMVRVLLTEQLYRAVSILHNHPYHRE